MGIMIAKRQAQHRERFFVVLATNHSPLEDAANWARTIFT